MGSEKDIAVVGMACVFPKAPNLKQYWSNLVNGVDAIDRLPGPRWRDHVNFRVSADHEAYIPSSRGGYLSPDTFFDPAAYGVPPNLVKHGDPDQFLMLHVIDHALKDARIADDHPVREQTDVIIGRGGYATGKLLELTMRAELYEIFIELTDRKFPAWTGDGRRQALEEYLRSTLTPKGIDNVSTAVSNITASRTANRLNLRGAAYIVDGACASSLLSVEQAAWRLRNRQCDAAVAAGLFISLSMTFLYVFTQLNALSPSQMIRPFDRRADGLLPGEGGGAVVLKRLEDALRDGDEIYAIIKGVGSASDGKAVDVLAPSSGGQVKALERAYADAGLDRDTISYLEVHGTGTVVGDLAEIVTIKTFFGTSPLPPTARAMGSVKSMIGHTMPAAGIASFIKTALMVSNKIIPPSLHCEEPRPELIDAPFYLNPKTRPWVHNPALGPRRAGINAFGFGGINAHVILEEVPVPNPKRNGRSTGSTKGAGLPETNGQVPAYRARPIETGLRRPSELAVFSAGTEAELADKLRRLERFLDQDKSDATLTDVAWTLTREVDWKAPVKLALVCDDLAHLRELLSQCLQSFRPVSGRDAVEEIYFAEDAAHYTGKIAVILPGMGFPGLIGDYPDHILELCLHYPEMREEFDFFEDRDRHPEDNIPTTAIFCPPATLPEDFRQQLKARLAPPRADVEVSKEALPRERYLAAMGVTLTNWACWALVRKFQLPVDMVTGQSQGELAAVCAAGISDFHENAAHFWKVLNIDWRDLKGGRLAFAWAPAEIVEPLLAENPGTYLAIHLARHGVIFGGDKEPLMKVAEQLREQNHLVQLLPYPPIHTPLMSHLRDELHTQLQNEEWKQIKIGKATIDLYSSITSRKYPADEAGIRETLMLNLDQPLRIWQTVTQMYEDGARVFVQVGGGHMAAHLEVMLPAGSQVVTTAMDVDSRNPLTQLNQMCAQLFTAGVPFNLEPLFEYRTVRELNLDAPQPVPAKPRMLVPLRIDWTPTYSENAPPRRSPVAVPEPPVVETSTVETPADEIRPNPVPESLAPSAPEVVVAAVDEPGVPVETATFDARLPVLGNLTHFVPREKLVIERPLDLAEDLFLHDHLFVYADCKPLEERLPVLPLTMSLEFAAEAASLLSPGLTLCGFEKVRGHHWIGLRDQSSSLIRIEAALQSIDPDSGLERTQVTVIFEDKPGFTTTVLFAPSYRQDVNFQIADSSTDGPWPFTAEQVYGDRLMFHGPRFFCVHRLETLGNPGASAELKLLPNDRLFASLADPPMWTDPTLMDGIGQIVGLWCMAHEQCILPIGVEKIEFYRATPPPGIVVPLRMETVSFDHDTRKIRCNVEIEDGQGCVWVRIAGWTEWVMNWPKRYVDFVCLPQRYLLAEELTLPGVPEGSTCMVMTRYDFRHVSHEWAARMFFHSKEMEEFLALDSNPRQAPLLFARSAIKEAVRLWWARQYGTPELPHPAAFAVAHDELGRPYLEPAGDPTLPHISLAHTGDFNVALAASVPVGIDVEPANRDTRSILADFATAEERELVDQLATIQPDEAWETRLWCAKEAAAKALGTGLQGRPKDFQALDVDADGGLLIHHVPTGERLVVYSVRVEEFIIAYTAATELIGDKVLDTQGRLEVQ
jgi:acyl transferase domain-containing protein/phosphopantetheinyl transferase (holo-ACP synthase)